MPSEFAIWLGEQARARHWRQKDLADAVGVSQQSASRWLLGQSVPALHSAQALARALGVATDEVVERLGEKPSRNPSSDEELAALRKRVEQLEEQLRARRKA